MCGIVGLFLKNKALEPELGKMMSGMLATMCDRGPDSAGFAVYGAGDSGHVKLTVRAMSPNFDFASLAGRLSEAVGSSVAVDVRESHGIFTVPEDAEQTARKTIEAIGDDVRIVGSGTRMEIYKEVGRPDAVAKRFHLEKMAGLARHRPHPHGDRVQPSPPTAPILSPRAAISASCITARCPITTRSAGSSSATA